MNSFNFEIDKKWCTSCGMCMSVCSTDCIVFGDDGFPKLRESSDGIQGLNGCYRCQRCMAVCPARAISFMGKDPANSIPAREIASKEQLEGLMRNRRSCRRYKDMNVPKETIDEILALLENAPTGTNLQGLGFNVVYDKDEMAKFRKMFREEAFRLADQEGIYPVNMTKDEFERRRELEPKRSPGDMFFVNAPHMLLIYSEKGKEQWQLDPVIAATWFDLICASRGLGSIMLTIPVDALPNMPQLQSLLGLPENSYLPCIMGFGYPTTKFSRGVQREGIAEIKELTF